MTVQVSRLKINKLCWVGSEVPCQYGMFMSRFVDSCRTEQHKEFNLEQLAYMCSFWHCLSCLFVTVWFWFVFFFLTIIFPHGSKWWHNIFCAEKYPQTSGEHFQSIAKDGSYESKNVSIFHPGRNVVCSFSERTDIWQPNSTTVTLDKQFCQQKLLT